MSANLNTGIAEKTLPPSLEAAISSTSGSGMAGNLSWKVARRIVPVAVVGYIVAQIDRGNVAFAKLQFMSDLAFNEAIFGLGAGLFFVGYFLFEVPSNLLLARIGARLTFSRIMILWGAISVGMVFVTTPTQFYVMRFLLGAAEAGFFPGVILYFSFWLPGDIRGRATSFFAMGASIAGVIGSPLSGWLLSLNGMFGLRGWQIIFMFEGMPAVLLGIFCFFYIDDKPENAKWLTRAEKDILKTRLQSERPSAAALKSNSFADAMRDPAVYLLALAYLSILAGTQAVSLWTPTLLKHYGLASTTIGLLAAVPPLAAIVSVFFVARSSDRRQERRWHFAASMIAAAAGLALIGVVPAGVGPTMALLSITSAGTWAAVAVFWTIPPAYLSSTSKAFGIGFISSAGAIGGFVSPVIIGWSSELTGSLFGGLAVIGAMLAISALCLIAGLRRMSTTSAAR
jgi:ACS family phthalate transporter-like MFS transporter